MKKVLFVTYFFPPSGGGGIQRSVKFIKYLPSYGWEPIVLTVLNPSIPTVDNSYLNEIPKNLKVYYSKTFEPNYSIKSYIKNYNKSDYSVIAFIKRIISYFMIPDPQILWLPTAAWHAIKIILKDKPNVMFITGPPFSSFIIGIISKLITGIPLVVDFRDEWIGFYDKPGYLSNTVKNNYIADIINKFIEKICIRVSSAVVTASPGYVENFIIKYPNIENEIFTCITNGYDPDDFKKLINYNNSHNQDVVNVIKFGYAGTVFSVTTLRYLVSAIKHATNINNKIKLYIYGRVTDDEMVYIKQLEPDMYELCGYIDHAQLIEQLNKMDYLVLTLDDIDGAERVIPGKIFEYIALNKNIIALIPKGEAENIMKSYRKGWIVNPREHDKICNMLINISNSDSKTEIQSSNLHQYSRIYLTEKLANIFEKVSLKE